MGIRGLNSFMNSNRHLTVPYELHNTKVVIDGKSLAWSLYDGNKIPKIFGGDYDRYASVIKCYFSMLLKCEIKPIVIFEGSHDNTDAQLQTILRRTETLLKDVDSFAKKKSRSDIVAPIFLSRVFKEVIKELNIAHAQCSHEAGGSICNIANFYKCPVISKDSDFYIFDISYGFIRTDSIDLTIKVSKNDEGQKYCYLSCDIYYVNNLLSFFPGIEKSVLPLFSTLLGNDFADPSIFDNFFQSDDFPTVRSVALNAAKRYQRMIGLLEWLRMCRDVEDAIERVLQCVHAIEKESVETVFEKHMNVHKIARSQSAICPENKLRAFVLRVASSEETLTSFNGTPVPVWFAENFHNSDISSDLMNIIGLRRNILPVMLQDTTLPSAHTCSLPIRRILYGLLLSIDNTSEEYDAYNAYIEEYDREKIELVKPPTHLKRFGRLPKLCEVPQLSVEEAKRLMSCTLQQEASCPNNLPEDLQLLVMCIRYWLRNSSPKPSGHYLDALLLNILYLTVAEPRVTEDPKTMNNRPLYYQRLSPNFCKKASFSDLMKEVSESNVAYLWENIQKYLHGPKLDHRNWHVIVSMIHSFSQLQGCLLYSLKINDVIGKPFSDLKLYRTLSGSLICNIALELQMKNCPLSFLSELLGPRSVLTALFEKFKSEVMENKDAHCLLKQGQRRKKMN